jgi:hypothetical protein
MSTLTKDETSKVLENLVPIEKQNKRTSNGQTPYEVLNWYTHFEWNNTHDEKDIKRRIVAKFSSYEDALRFATQQAESGYYTKVTVRA